MVFVLCWQVKLDSLPVILNTNLNVSVAVSAAPHCHLVGHVPAFQFGFFRDCSVKKVFRFTLSISLL